MAIPLLDLKTQYLNIKEEIDQAVLQVLSSAKFILGPEGKALEKEIASYCQVSSGVGVGNGTDALVLALEACGVGPGDEVLTTPFTFFSSAETIAGVGAVPVFVDIDPLTLNMDLSLLEAKITKKTKAVVAVHIFGQMLDMFRLMDLARQYGLHIIEDAAQSIGSEYEGRRAGSFGHAGTLSFFPTKNLGGYGDGGMVVTNDEEISEKVRVLRFHGCRTKYYHDEIGYNSRLDEIQAAVLRVKFRYLDEWNQARRDAALFYDEALADLAAQGRLILPGRDPRALPTYHLYVLRTPQREKLMKGLQEAEIAAAIYYPVPLHLQKAFAYLGYEPGELPEAEKACREALAIPCYPELTAPQLERIAQKVREILCSGM